MATTKGYTQFIGPITLAAGDVWTYAHAQGQKARFIDVLDEDRCALTQVYYVDVVQPDATQLVATNVSAGPLTIYLRVEWTPFAPAADLPGSVGNIVIVPPPPPPWPWPCRWPRRRCRRRPPPPIL